MSDNNSGKDGAVERKGGSLLPRISITLILQFSDSARFVHVVGYFGCTLTLSRLYLESEVYLESEGRTSY